MKTFRLITYEKAENEVENLQRYLKLIDNYKVNNINQFIIKYYAITNSSAAVIREYNNRKFFYNLNYDSISHELIMEVIKSSPTDDLHRLLRIGFRKKYKR